MRIIWMDGKSERYPYTHQHVAEGELHLWVENGPPGTGLTWTSDERWIPLMSVRERQAL